MKTVLPYFIEFLNVCQRVRVWLVALARTKLVKETEPVGKSAGFSEYTQTSNWLYTLLYAVILLNEMNP